jgi:hypothetical protein
LAGSRRLTLEEKEAIRAKNLISKDKNEYKNRGNYDKIYPLNDSDQI